MKAISAKNYYLTLLLCSLFGMFGAHLFYLARYKDGMIRILETFVLVGIYFWLQDFAQLYFRGGFLDGQGKALPKYSEWYAKNPLNKYQKKMFQESKDNFAESKRNFAEAKQHFSDSKKQLSEAKEIFLEPFIEKELDNIDSENK